MQVKATTRLQQGTQSCCTGALPESHYDTSATKEDTEQVTALLPKMHKPHMMLNCSTPCDNDSLHCTGHCLPEVCLVLWAGGGLGGAHQGEPPSQAEGQTQEVG